MDRRRQMKELLAITILTLNEEADLPECLDSIGDLEAKVFVIDSNSSDKTVELAKSRGCSVVNFEWNGKYPKKKQWAIDYLFPNFEWVLMLDADERLSVELREEIKEKLSTVSQEVSAFDVRLEYWFQNRKLRWGMKTAKRILVRSNRVVFPVQDDLHVTNMWEVEGHYQPILKIGKSKKLRGTLVHNDSGDLYSYLSRHNRYSDWEAMRSNDNSAVHASGIFHKIFRRLPFKGFIIFIFSYIFRLGFLDGRAGFDYAVNQSFYHWQVSAKRHWGKLSP